MTVETIDIILSVGEAFISSTGKKFEKGNVYTLPKDEATKLLSVKGDFDIRFFKKSEGGGVKAIAKNVEEQDTHPTPRQIAESMNQEGDAVYAAAQAIDKADAIASATRGQGDEFIEQQLVQKQRISVAGSVSPTGATSATGEVDTADNKAKGRGRPANAVAV